MPLDDSPLARQGYVEKDNSLPLAAPHHVLPKQKTLCPWKKTAQSWLLLKDSLAHPVKLCEICHCINIVACVLADGQFAERSQPNFEPQTLLKMISFRLMKKMSTKMKSLLNVPCLTH